MENYQQQRKFNKKKIHGKYIYKEDNVTKEEIYILKESVEIRLLRKWMKNDVDE